MSELYLERLGQTGIHAEAGKLEALKLAAQDVINTGFPEDQKQVWLLELNEIAEREGLDSTYVDFLYEQVERSINGKDI
jgi:hypothetical protein